MTLLRHKSLPALTIFGCGLLLFTIQLCHQEVIGFEARFYLFAVEMWRHGLSFFPTAYQQPYPDYPGLATILIVAFSKCMGHLNKLTAVFPSAVAAAVTLAMTYQIGALHSARWGWFAVFFLLLTNTFVMEARTISPDQYIAMVTVICFYLVYSAEVWQKTKRLGFIPFLFLLGFAFRGPIGLVVPAGVVSVFYLLDNQFKKFLLMCVIAAVMLTIGCLLLFGAAYHMGGAPFMHDVLQLEVLGRMHDAYLPWYFYFTESLGAYAVTYPLAILILMGYAVMRGESRFIQKLFGWAFVIIIGLTIPAGKKIRYILAFAPALALISASLFAAYPPQKYFVYLRKMVLGVCFVLPASCYLALVVVSALVAEKQLPIIIAFPVASMIFFLLQMISIVYIKRDIVIVGAAAMAFLTSYIFLVEPVNLGLNRTQGFVQQVESARDAARAKLVFYQENSDAMPIKYVVDMSRDEIPVFVNKQDELMQIKQPVFVVMSREHFVAMPKELALKFNVLYEGKVGHEQVVVVSPRPTLSH